MTTPHSLLCPSPTSNARSRRARPLRAAVLGVAGLTGIFTGACDCGFWDPVENGWVVECFPGAEANPDAPHQVCLNRNVYGGVTDDALSAACAQAANEHDEDGDFTLHHFPFADVHQEDDYNAGCTMELHPFPVFEIWESGGADEVGTSHPNANAAFCSPIVTIRLGDEELDGPTTEFVADIACMDSAWEELAAMDACAAKCEAWAASVSEDYPDFLFNDDGGNCDPGNFIVFPQYSQSCEAASMQGAVWEANARVSFADGLNALTLSGDGVLAYDDSSCNTSGSCEPEVLMTFAVPSAGFAFQSEDGSVHDVAATGLQLSTLQPTAITTDPASGRSRIEELEFELLTEDATVDGVSIGPLHLRDIVGPIDVAIDHRASRFVLSGSADRFGADVALELSADMSSPTTWPER